MDASSLIQNFSIHNSSIEYHALLVGQYGYGEYLSKNLQKESLRELFLLADTAKISHIQQVFLYISEPNSKYFLNSGHLDMIKNQIQTEKINLLIIDIELKAHQIRNLEEFFKIRSLGRVELILDIFSMRAKTKEALLQVELAQLNYILPRLKGLGGVLSRLGGGIGTRGPGETMLETDRRHLNKRIQKLKKSLEQIKVHRSVNRKNRNLFTFALVGYTNAGKTTLLNQLTKSPKQLFAEDRLFATLSTFSRKVFLGNISYKPTYSIVTDTIGFLQNLPSSLIQTFRSTLEEIKYNDALILVLDSSSYFLEKEYSTVIKEITKLSPNLLDKIILFLNKSDLLLRGKKKEINQKLLEYKESQPVQKIIYGSSITKEGIQSLKQEMFKTVCRSKI